MLDDSIDLRSIQEVRAVIHTESGPIIMNEFAEFLYLFRIGYAATINALGASDEPVTPDASQSLERIVQLTRDHLSNLSRADIARLGTEPLEVEPAILTIQRDNPLIILFVGAVIAFGVATILSGGKFKGLGLDIEIPPLGHGIIELKKALRF